MNKLKFTMILTCFTAGSLLFTQQASAKDAAKAVLENYADIAQAKYEVSLSTAKALQKQVDQLIAAPTDENLQAAKQAWVAARIPYQQTEAYRFGNVIVDEWEGKVNAWPLYTANIIANPKIKVAGKEIDATDITKELLQDQLQEADGIETNIATGYHAVEFLLWGQDLNGH